MCAAAKRRDTGEHNYSGGAAMKPSPASWRDRLTLLEIALRMVLIAALTLLIPPLGRWVGKLLAVELKLNYLDDCPPTLRSAVGVYTKPSCVGLGLGNDDETKVERMK
jgi:hypothetical protein